MEGDGSADARDPSSDNWRFLVDENLDPAIVSSLKRSGFDAEHVLEALFEGADDFQDILPYCLENRAILVTNNVRDFNAATISPDDHAGIIIVHDKDRPARLIADELRRIAKAYQRPGSLRGFETADDWSL